MFNKRIILILISLFIITSTIGFVSANDCLGVADIDSSNLNDVDVAPSFEVANFDNAQSIVAVDEEVNATENVTGDENVTEKVDLSDDDFNATFITEEYNNFQGVLILPTNATGNVSLYIDDVLQGVYDLVNGSTTWNITNITIGSYNVMLTYNGDDYYNEYSDNYVVDIVKAIPNIIFKHLEMGRIVIGLPYDATGDVTLTIGNDTYETLEVTNGTVVYDIDNMTLGTYDLTVEYSGDENYEARIINEEVTIDTMGTNIDVSNVTKYFRNNTQLVFSLISRNGTLLSNQTVIISINGVNYKRTTNENGSAKLTINLAQGNYTASISFNGTDSYIGSNATADIVVLPIIESSDFTKYYTNDTKFSVILLNEDGTVASNKEVSFNINGVFYTSTSDENGTATLNANLAPKSYIVTSIFNNCSVSNTFTIVAPVESSDFVKYFGNASKFEATLLDDNATPIANKSVTLNINGVSYKRTSNENGTVRLAINLAPSTYVMTILYDGAVITNMVTVLSTIETDDIVMSEFNRVPFTAKILDGQGKPAVGQNVTFNLEGIIYNVVSDDNGIASLVLPVQEGKYIITTGYSGITKSNTITIL